MGASFSGGSCPRARPRSHASSRGDGWGPCGETCLECGSHQFTSLGSEQKTSVPGRAGVSYIPTRARAFLDSVPEAEGCACLGRVRLEGKTAVRLNRLPRPARESRSLS